MHCHGNSLDHCCLFKADIVRQPIKNPLRHGNVFCERAVPPVFATRNAKHTAVFAKVHLATLAEPAFAAINRRVEGNAVAFTPTGDTAAHFRNDAGGFVAHDDRRNPPAGTSVHSMHVAAADAAGAHANQNFIGRQSRRRKILNGEAAIFFEDESLHWAESSVPSEVWPVGSEVMRGA